MKKMNFLKIACAAALSAACCFAAVGCSQTKSDSGDVSVSDTSEGVAATVNGTEIGEKAVTSYIANFRSMSNLESDADWAQWLVDNNYNAAARKSSTITRARNSFARLPRKTTLRSSLPKSIPRCSRCALTTIPMKIGKMR